MLASTDRVTALSDTSATEGIIRWDPVKSIWYFAHLAGSIAAILFFFDLSAIAAMVALTAITICAGHSVGMHRLLIHRSFATPIWLEHILVWLGTLVGMAGPMGMIKAHDMRDWHQRQTVCPPHPSHGAGFWKDAWWQLHCRFDLVHPPRFDIEPRVANDRFYRFIERTWMLQQLPVALVLWAVGGWSWVLWGICVRVVLSLTGHWVVGHFAHRSGHQGWHIDGLPVQGYNIQGLGLLTFGENWHGNHHAFPHSAQLGIERGQSDPGYVLIGLLQAVGLAWNVQTPGSQPEREGLKRFNNSKPAPRQSKLVC